MAILRRLIIVRLKLATFRGSLLRSLHIFDSQAVRDTMLKLSTDRQTEEVFRLGLES